MKLRSNLPNICKLTATGLLIGTVATPSMASEVSSVPFGTTANGAAVDVYTMRNRSGMNVSVLSYGGALHEITAPDRKGKINNVIVSLPDLKAYEHRANFSTLLGRYANRISNGGFTIDGVHYPLPSNSHGITSHGGPKGFGSRVWTGKTFSRGKHAGVELSYRSADGENGFPGNLSVSATYTLTDDNTLRIDYRATTDKPTVVNLSHHVYFNLAGNGCVCEQTLQVFADRYTPIDARKLVTGAIEPVAGTPLDLRQPVLLRERLDADHAQIRFGDGLDHNFVLNQRTPSELSRAARLEDPAAGRVLDVYTTQPGLQVYTGNGFDGSLKDAAGRPIQRRGGIALETQHFPDSPNHPEYPTTELRPGQTFVSTTEFRFGVDR